MAVEWVSVIHPDLDAPAASVNRKHFEEILKGKGFVLESTAKKKKEKKVDG